MTGTRFVDTFDEAADSDSDSYYTPRHLRAVTLSPDLQRALDEAFSPEPEPVAVPEPEQAVVPDPEPIAAAELEPAPARAMLCLVIPETIEFEPAAFVGAPEPVRAELAAVAPEQGIAATMPAPEPVPSGPAAGAFPDPSAYAARRFSGEALSAPTARGGMFRRRVDPSRLMVSYSSVALG